MIREAHAATKDLRAAVREAKRELQDLAKDEVAAHVQREVSRQLEELGERTQETVSAATQKVIAEFDRFGESLLGKETYWQTASGRRTVTRPDTDMVTLDVQPGDVNPNGLHRDGGNWPHLSRSGGAVGGWRPPFRGIPALHSWDVQLAVGRGLSSRRGSGLRY